MAQDWRNLLNTLGAADTAEDFGNASEELAAAKSGTIVVPLEDLALLRIAGPDATDYLHNLLTNDVKNLAADEARFAGLCSAKGRLQASFWVWRDGDDLLVQLSADLVPAIAKKLSLYILRSKVKVADISGEQKLIGIAGDKAAQLLAQLGGSCPPPGKVAACANGQIVALGEQRYMVSLSAEAAAAALPGLAGSAKLAGTAAWRWQEIAAAQPRIVAATLEAFVPQMVNMELPAVSGVSFHKGCYPGQEIVARTQYLGKIKRRMYRARLDNAFPAGTDVFAPETGDQHCGALATVAPSPDGGYECLVVVQSSAAEAGDVRIGSPQGPRLGFLPMPYPLE